MQIVTDRGMDMPQSLIDKYNIHIAPLYITLEGKTYQSGVDIDSKGFYELLDKTDAFPLTSMPSPGDFAKLFSELAETDPDILYISISKGLSGTYKAAKEGAKLAKNANVTLYDSKTLGCPEGWQVEAAAKTLAMGWDLNQILTYLKSIRLFANGMFTLSDMKYLVHGGRISHIKGLLATALQLQPIIKVDKGSGKYTDAGKGRTMKGSIRQMATILEKTYGVGARLRIQLLHGNNPKGIELLQKELNNRFDEILFDETMHIAPVLGAHTGPSMIGFSVGPAKLFENPVPETNPESFLDLLKLPGFSIPLLNESNL